jgi:hypothetical protein
MVASPSRSVTLHMPTWCRGMIASSFDGHLHVGNRRGDQMRRRSFIVLLGTPMTLRPFAATAERPQRVRRIGVLMTYSAPNSEARVFAQAFLDAFQQRLQELGLITPDCFPTGNRASAT